MKIKIVGLFVCMLLIALSFQIPATALFDDAHEITDEEGDTRFDYVDVVWASFYENPDEPEYLYAALKISNLQDKIGCVYAIHWYLDNVHYAVGIHNGMMIPYREFKSWGSDYYEKRSYIDTWNDSLNSGSFDLQNSIISWKVHKSCIGSPQPGDVLTHSFVFTAQRISIFGLIPFGIFFKSFFDESDPSESIDYIIQY
jgi:hypothetical protein